MENLRNREWRLRDKRGERGELRVRDRGLRRGENEGGGGETERKPKRVEGGDGGRVTDRPGLPGMSQEILRLDVKGPGLRRWVGKVEGKREIYKVTQKVRR